MKTNYFNMIYPGHGGGDFFLLNCANHPQPMTVLIEAYKDEMLRFEERGLDRVRDYDPEILRVFKYRKGRDACVGNLKCEHPLLLDYIAAEGGRIFHVVRNPIALIGPRFGRKHEAARVAFRRQYGKEAKTEANLFEGTILKYKERFHKTYLDRAARGWPTIRLEDLNDSIGRDGLYFKRVMEWVTQTDWPLDYIQHIRMHHTPGHNAGSRAVFDESGNLLRLIAWPTVHWLDKVGQWVREDLTKDGPAAYWNSWSDEQRCLYRVHYSELDRRMGYNQDHPGSTDDEWEQKERFL